MSKVVLLTGMSEPGREILPSLGLLHHAVRVARLPAGASLGDPPGSADAARAQGGSLAPAPAGAASPGGSLHPDLAGADVVLVDARKDLVRARQACGVLGGAGTPVLAVITEGGWAAVTATWGADDVILDTAGPGEVEARIRLAIGRASGPVPGQTEEIRSGELVINEETYSAKVGRSPLDLTFKEFELLKFLAQHPRRVFTRAQLLSEVWGYDYFGGNRTVDVHVRRLRAKLGIEHDALIGTVRNVGYKFVPAKPGARQLSEADAPPGADAEGGTEAGTEVGEDEGWDGEGETW